MRSVFGPQDVLNLPGLTFLLLGVIGVLLCGFSLREVRAALRTWLGRGPEGGDLLRSAEVFEAAARNTIALGVLVAIIGFVHLVGLSDGGISHFLARMARVLVPCVFGLALASLLGGPATVLRERARQNASAQSAEPERGQSTPIRWLFHSVVVVLIAWMAYTPKPEPMAWLTRWTAWLVVLGGAWLLGLLYGDLFKGRGLSVGLAIAATLGALSGLLQSMHGFASKDIQTVSAGISFAVTCCFVGLAGMLALAFPLEDRARRAGGGACPSRLAWYGFPLTALFILLAVVIMVITPMEMTAGGG